ncbi:MAG: hypothetical protein BRC28_00655 [Nanohaloarchaea archaeon SW_4_43_9]|nr:MAG: hypothetical protein BRC28_00655 [Nanohaloarchaea archaeon SW_4_43_9]
MLDGKILAAVLTTLTAIAVTTGQGANTQNMDLQAPELDEFSPEGLMENPLQKLRNIVTDTPEPENKVKADLRVQELEEETVNIEGGAKVRSNSTDRVQLGDKVIESDTGIEFYGFEGTLKPVNETTVSGTVQGVLTSGVNISGQAPVSQSFNTTKLEIRGVEESTINLGQVLGSIESENASTSFNSARPLKINSFSGDITVYPRNATFVLDGEVARLEAGSFTFGG